MNITDRARGAMVGMAVGEALGAPLEGLTREEIEKQVGRVAGFVHPAKAQPEHRAAYFLAGGYEDETQAALAAADVVVRKQAFQVEFFAERLAELGQPIEGKVFGCFRRAHRNLRVSVRRLLSGVPWSEAGVVTAGSTAASRGIPIGIWYREDEDERIRAGLEAALVTHRDVRACAATVTVAEGIAAALAADLDSIDPSEVLKRLARVARAAEDRAVEDYSEVVGEPGPEVLHQFSDAVASLEGLLDLELDDALERIRAFASERGSRPITSATKGFALTGVISALYFFITGISESFDETVLDAISEGGSSDTLGCLVGGLCGALFGIDGLPREWLRSLRNVEQVDLRGAALSGVETPPPAPLVLMEAKLTRPAPSLKKPRRSMQRRRPQTRGRPDRGRGGPPRGRGGPPRRGPPRGGGRPYGGGGGPRRGPGGPRRDGPGGGPRRDGPGGGGPRRGPPRRDGPPRGGGPRRDGPPRQGGGGGGRYRGDGPPRRPGGGYRGDGPPPGGRDGYRGGGPRRGGGGGYRGDGPPRRPGGPDGPRRDPEAP